MAKDKDDREDFDEDLHDDGDDITEEGSTGPGRGTRLTSVPKHSVFTVMCGVTGDDGRPVKPVSQAEAEERRRNFEKLRGIAIWAVRHVRTDGIEEDAIQAIMFAFARHAIPPGMKKRDVLKMAKTTAKRWALEEKRILHFPMVLDRKDHFDKKVREACLRADTDLGLDEDAADSLRHDDFVDELEATGEGEGIDWNNIPPEMEKAINLAWREVHPRVTKVMRHMLMGESIARAAELEAVAYQTAVTHMRTFMQAAQGHLQ